MMIEVNPPAGPERPSENTLLTANAPIEPVPGRLRVQQILKDQRALQGPRVFQQLSEERRVSVHALALGTECVVSGFEPAVAHYPSGDFVKVVPLGEDTLLFALIDFPGKGVMLKLDGENRLILAEDASVSEMVVALHGLLEMRSLTPDNLLGMLDAGVPPECLYDVDLRPGLQDPADLLSTLSLKHVSLLLEAMVAPLYPDAMPAGAFVRINTRTGEGEFLSRGHTVPLIIVREQAARRDSSWSQSELPSLCELLVNNNSWWGLPGACSADRFTLAPGDQLLMMSDGLGEARLSTRSPHYHTFEQAVIKGAGADTEPGFFDNILCLAPDALFCPDGERSPDPFPRLLELLDIFERRDDAAVLTYTHQPVT